MSLWHDIKYKIWLKKTYSRLDSNGVKYGKNLKLYNADIDQVYGYLITIGDDCTLTNCVILAHDASTQLFSHYTKVGTVNIGNKVYVGHSAIILPGVSIGNNVIIGAGTVVTKDIPSNSVVVGNPGHIISSISTYKDKVLHKYSKHIIENNSRKTKVEKSEDYKFIFENNGGLSIKPQYKRKPFRDSNYD